MRSKTPASSGLPDHAPTEAVLPVATRPGRGPAAIWALVGLLCCAGVVLAFVDPSLAGGASGPSLDGSAPGVAPDDGFVAPPRAALKTAKPATKTSTPSRGTVTADQMAREAHADALIQKLITKMRLEREAEKADRLAKGNCAAK